MSVDPMRYVFWASAGFLVYVYVGYPALMALRARWWPRPVRRGDGGDSFSVVMVAHNEAGRVEAKLDNLATVKGMEAAEKVIVASDGSDDGTAELVRRWVSRAVDSADEGRRRLARKIVVREFPVRRGKPAVLNEVMPECAGQVVVFMDVRQELDREALMELLADFADPEVVVVSGDLVFRRAEDTVGRGVSAYWRYEKALRRWESRSGSVPGATGAFYGVRRAALSRLPEDILLDDVYVPMCATEIRGRCVLEERARIYDDPAACLREEETRKVRTLAGNFQLLFRRPRWAVPGGHRWWGRFLSHKVLRLAAPLWLVLLLGANVVEAGRPFYAGLLALQVVWYVAGVAGMLLAASGRRRGAVLGLPAVFLSFHGAVIKALWRYARGRVRVTWEKAS